MSPLLLRRYRADRLLREEFEALQGRVIGAVAGRIRGSGGAVDRGDLEAAYAQAWQGLHAAILEGDQIDNPAGWLVVVTHRRAVDEHRARRPACEAPLEEIELGEISPRGACSRHERDLAGELDDRVRLRTLLAAWRLRLSEREQLAAALCYLQGLSRVEAAARMGLSPARMRKLMDGGKGLLGVAAKVGALARSIAAGEWCEEQGSLMRGLAFGILDPGGERYRQALAHSDQCPACRSYVLSLRGLAAALPPLPALLQWVSAGAGTAAGAGGLAGTVSGSAPGAAGAAAPAAGSGITAGSGLGAGSLPGLAGAGAAGGGWWLAGGFGAKLAVGCLLALGVGAGCLALEGRSPERSKVGRAHPHARLARAPTAPTTAVVGESGTGATRLGPGASAVERDRPSAAASGARREFSPEAALARRTSPVAPPRGAGSAAATRSTARAARAQAPEAPGGAGAGAAATSRAESRSTLAPAATREFGPG